MSPVSYPGEAVIWLGPKPPLPGNTQLLGQVLRFWTAGRKCSHRPLWLCRTCPRRTFSPALLRTALLSAFTGHGGRFPCVRPGHSLPFRFLRPSHLRPGVSAGPLPQTKENSRCCRAPQGQVKVKAFAASQPSAGETLRALFACL